jgi:thymidylate synthase
MRQYLDLLDAILTRGVKRADRTGVGTLSIFGYQMRFDLSRGFPLLTTKKLHLPSIIHELLWFLRGETNNRWLEERRVTIWREWAREDGALGPIYGKQWRRWEQVEFIVPTRYEPPPLTPQQGRVAGVGYGTERRHESAWTEHLYDIWSQMLHRCYDPTWPDYPDYGGRGVFVVERWHDFNNFLADALRLPNGMLKREFPDEYELNLDYYGSNRYGPGTCLWLSKHEQALNAGGGRMILAESPSGDRIVTLNIAGVCQDYGLDLPAVESCLRKERDSYQGWTFTPVEGPAGFRPRLRIRDQIKEAVALIKHAPESRRIVVSAWNVSDLERMSLAPCHLLFQFYVAEGRLSCQVYQRSADVFLGLPFNIASYALLTMMMAQVCDLMPGELIHTLGDAHLYLTHLDQARVQLSRQPRPLPQVTLNPRVRSLDDFRYEDITVTGYDPHPPLKAPVAV